jgi:hypothetical protein
LIALRSTTPMIRSVKASCSKAIFLPAFLVSLFFE